LPAALGLDDHLERRPVLHAARGVVPLELAADLGAVLRREPREPHERRVAHEIEHSIVDAIVHATRTLARLETRVSGGLGAGDGILRCHPRRYARTNASCSSLCTALGPRARRAAVSAASGSSPRSTS